MPAMIVAEIGVNWNGDRSRIPQFIEAAKNAGATHVKFQAYNTDKLVARRGITDQATIDLLRRNELTDDDLDLIAREAKRVGIPYFWSVFDVDQPARCKKFGATHMKVGHKEADWPELLEACLATGKSVWVSNPPWKWIDEPSVGSVHCIAEYPATSSPKLHEIDCCNSEKPHGFSSHYQSWRVPAAAALRGAQFIEAHFKLSDQDPEAAWSLSADDFGKMVKQIREFESWL